MILKKVKSEGIASLSYFLASGNEACVIDPRRDAKTFLKLAWDAEAEMKYVFETHRNEDYVIGSKEIADVTNVDIYHGPRLDWKYGKILKDGQEFNLGALKIKAIHTPGHTDESMSYAVYDTSTGEEAVMVFTGDALFVGDTGRIDMYGPKLAEQNSSNLYNSLFNKLLPLGDQCIILPAHGAGSVCGADINEREISTIGLERMQNHALQLRDKQNFIQFKLSEHHYYAPYFKKMEEFNLNGPPLLKDVPRFKPLLPGIFKKELEQGGVVVDTRNPASFGSAHIKGSYNIWLKGLPSHAGWILPYDKPLLLVVENFNNLKKAYKYLLRIGYDNIKGYLVGSIIAWYSNHFPIETIETITVDKLKNKLENEEEIFLIDVRSPPELKEGYIKQANNIYVGEILDEIEKIPKNKAIVTVCGNGARASMASSILKKNGFRSMNVLGSMKAWRNANFPLVK
ncbi:MAG: MBL fold metallo-hydrolase [Promethearchaeota archaeon]|nr:MAG: MBL fold metallo-hydrolase [Candidatus Lokiarchaeota archaeon]